MGKETIMKPVIVEVDGNKYVKLSDDGKAVFNVDGKEIGVDVEALNANLTNTMAEAKSHRLAKEEALTTLKTFEGIDPSKAKEALDKVKGLSDKDLIDAGEAERVRNEAIAATEEKYKPIVEENGTLKGRLSDSIIGGLFSGSEFIGENLAVPADMLRSTFGKRFRLEDDNRVTALDDNGNPLLSKKSPGSHASFDEAIEIMVDAYPHKKSILKGANQDGSGGEGGDGGGNGGTTITRAAFDQLDPSAQGKMMKDGVKIHDAA